MLKPLWLDTVIERHIWKTWLGWNAVALHPARPLFHSTPQLFSPTIIYPALLFPPITSTLTAYFCSPVVTNVAFSASLNRLTPKQATHSDTGSKTVHPCAALNPAQARLRRGKLRCVVTDQRLVSTFVQRAGSDVKCAFPRARCFPLTSWSRTHWQAELWDGLLRGECCTWRLESKMQSPGSWWGRGWGWVGDSPGCDAIWTGSRRPIGWKGVGWRGQVNDSPQLRSPQDDDE